MNVNQSLVEYQKAFSDYILKGENERNNLLAVLISDKSEDGLARNNERIKIYRNNIHFSLIDVLSKLYPVTNRVVGDDCFSHIARGYIKQCPPKNSVLSLYGQYFSEYILFHEISAPLPYLSELVRLEWACHEVLNAKDDFALNISGLIGVDEDELNEVKLELRSSVLLIKSIFPIDQIWFENQKKEVGKIVLEKNESVCMLVVRQDDVVNVVTVRPEVFMFLEIINSGCKMIEAWEEIKMNYSLHDEEFSSILAYLFGLEVFSEVDKG